MASELASREDIRTRLHNTVCMYKNKPVFITVEPVVRGTNEHLVSAYEVGDQRKYSTIDYRSDDFSNSSPQLGYLKYGADALYMYRTAHRQFQLGVSSTNIRATTGTTIGRSDLLTKEFEQCITGNHVSIDRAISLLSDGLARSVPIHRHFAIGKLGERGLSLFHRGEAIAVSPSMTHRNWTFMGAPSVASFYQKIAQREGIEL